MLKAIYNALWYPALPFVLMATKSGDPELRRQRLGKIDPAALTGAGPPRIWIHAASVGEIECIRPIACGLLREVPAASLIITTMTPAGLKAARNRIPGARAHLLAPLDCRPCVRSFIGAVQPDIFLVAETELWPNCIIEAKKSSARVAIINGRVSDRSFPRYMRARGLFAEALSGVSLVAAQTGRDAERFAALGVPEDRIFVTGNTKFELDGGANDLLRPELRAFAESRRLLVAGSTAPGEERPVMEAFAALRSRFADLTLVIAPRHLERLEAIEKMLKAARITCVRSSVVTPGSDVAALLLDTFGELRGLYALAAIAFVGGTLVEGRGGQNLAEPAAKAVPILFGPFHSNQRELADALVDAGGGIIVKNSAELAQVASELLLDPNERAARGKRARTALEGFGGAVRSTLMQLRALTGAA